MRFKHQFLVRTENLMKESEKVSSTFDVEKIRDLEIIPDTGGAASILDVLGDSVEGRRPRVRVVLGRCPDRLDEFY